jgi:hypothetical protein
MERCSICVLPTTCSAVTFDGDGVCSLCAARAEAKQEEEAVRKEKARDLDSLAGVARGRGGPYDCVVPVSGGRDSAYAAWYVTRRLGLRALGVNYDNGYRSPSALRNLDAISDRLGMGLVTLRPDPGFFRRVFAHFLRETGYFCNACDAAGYIVAGSFLDREARRLGYAPLVVGGWSRKYEYQPGLSVLSMSDFGRILGRAPGLVEEMRACPLVEPRIFDAFVSTGDIRQTGSRGATVPGLIQLPDYVEWDYGAITETLEREIGWASPEGRPGAHFDCLLAPIPSYLKLRKFGFCQETIRMSALVREGRMAREEALSREEAARPEEPQVFRDVLAQWGLEPEDVAWDAEWSR